MGSSGGQYDEYLQAGAAGRGVVSEFYFWIETLLLYQYQYVVFITRRASNLMEAVRKAHPEITLRYMTENGLLLQAEEIAKTYSETGHFPKIAIVDDILVYGRNMNLLLTQFWNTILQCLYRLDIDAEERNAEEAFIESISLWIYAVNEAPILLRHEFQWTMHTQRMISEGEWRSLSDSIARLIAAEDVANTSYVVSAKLPYEKERYRPNSEWWISDGNLRYRNNRQHYEFYLFPQASKFGAYPSVRIYKKRGFTYYTPYFFLPELPWAQMISILKALFNFSARQNLKATNTCIHLLNRVKECSSRLMVYAQFAVCLLSQVTLSVFFGDLDPQLEAAVEYDTEKIGRNFGFSQDMDLLLRSFCEIKWSEEQLMELLECLELSNEADREGSPPAAERANQAEVVNTVERLAYKQAVDHERDAAGRKKQDSNDDPVPSAPHVNQTGEQELGRFLSRVKENTGVRADAESMLTVLSCLTQMMDLGDISLKARSKRMDGIPVFYSSVRTTEMSLAIMPRKLGGYYRQFYLLAQLYWRDQDFPDRVERYFRNTIFSGDPEDKNAVIISNARYFAQLIIENRMIVSSMLNWETASD